MNPQILGCVFEPSTTSFIINWSPWQGSGQFKIHGHFSHSQINRRHFLTLAVVSEIMIENRVVAKCSMIYLGFNIGFEDTRRWLTVDNNPNNVSLVADKPLSIRPSIRNERRNGVVMCTVYISSWPLLDQQSNDRDRCAKPVRYIKSFSATAVASDARCRVKKSDRSGTAYAGHLVIC